MQRSAHISPFSHNTKTNKFIFDNDILLQSKIAKTVLLLTASFRMTFIVWLFLIFSFHHPNGTDYNGYTIEKCEKRTEIENIRCDKFWSVTKYIERTAHQNKSMKGKNKSGITSFENVVLFCCCAIRVAVLSCRCHRSCFFRFFQFFFPFTFVASIRKIFILFICSPTEPISIYFLSCSFPLNKR